MSAYGIGSGKVSLIYVFSCCKCRTSQHMMHAFQPDLVRAERKARGDGWQKTKDGWICGDCKMMRKA